MGVWLASRQVELSERQVQLAEEEKQLSHTALVALDDIEPPRTLAPNTPIEFTFVFKNTGNGPAFAVSISSITQLGITLPGSWRGVDVIFPNRGSFGGSETVLGQGQTVRVSNRFVLNDEMFAGIVEERVLTIRQWAAVRYSDTFGHKPPLTFCKEMVTHEYLEGSARWVTCHERAWETQPRDL